MKKLICALAAAAILLQSVCVTTFADGSGYGENICLGKSSFCSGIYHQGYGLQYINDGDAKTTFANGGDVDPVPIKGLPYYAAIDLDDIYKIDRIILYTRLDLNAEWCRINLAVGVATKSDLSDLQVLGEKNTPGAFGSTLNVKTRGDVYARYIVMIGNGAIGELEAYGEKTVIYEKGSYSDVTEPKYINAAKLTTMTDIITPESSSTFESMNLVTRGEAAQYAARLMRLEEAVYEGGFADVGSEHKYAGYIQSALKSGIISKSENFRPDDYVTKAEFLTMMLRVSGYSKRMDFSSQKLSWPGNVLAEAEKIKLTDGTEIQNYVNKQDAALVMYNLLLTPPFDVQSYTAENGVQEGKYSKSDETYLKKMFDMDLTEGVITADSCSSLNGELDFDEKRLKIGKDDYKNKSSAKTGLLGKKVYAVTDSDDNVLMVWKDSENMTEKVINSEDVDEIESNRITTLENGKKVSYRLNSPYTLKNGIADQNVLPADYKALSGELVLTDYDGNGTYDVIEVRKPQIIAVSASYYNEDERKIVIKGENGENLTLSDFEHISAHNFNGGEADLSSIKNGMLAFAYVSGSKKYADIVFASSGISGKVEETGKNTINIDGVDYETTRYFDSANKARLAVGVNAKFLLDKNGRIVYMSTDDFKEDTEFAAIMRGVLTNGLEMKFNIYDENGKFSELKASGKLKINGVSASMEYVKNLGSNYFTGKLALIKKNANDLITSIVTETTTDSQSALFKRTEDINGTYRSDVGYYLEGESTMKVPASDRTVAFTVPVDENNKLITSSDYDIFYKIDKLSDLYPAARHTIDDENVTLYGKDEFGAPYYAVVPQSYSVSSNDCGCIKWLTDRDALVITGISRTTDANGGSSYMLKGYDLISGVEKKVLINSSIKRVVDVFKIHNYTEYPEISGSDIPHSNGDWWNAERFIYHLDKVTDTYKFPIEQLKIGDIVRWSVRGSTSGAKALERVFSIDKANIGDKIIYSAGDLPGTIYSSFRLKYCTVNKFEKQHFYLEDGEVIDTSGFSGSVIVIDSANERVDAYPKETPANFVQSGSRVILYSEAAKFYTTVVVK